MALGWLAAGGFVQSFEVAFPEAFWLIGFVSQIFLRILFEVYPATFCAEVKEAVIIFEHERGILLVHNHSAHGIDGCCRVV